MRLVYVFNGRLPTEKAHGLQITKMCEAFANLGAQVNLLVPFRYNLIREDVFEYYSAKKNFTVKKLWALDPMSVRWFPERLAFFVQSVTSGTSIILFLLTRRYSKDTVFYARDYVSLFILSILGFCTIAEIHDYRFLKPRLFIKHIFKKCSKIIVNSGGTLNSVRAHYKIPDNKFVVAPNGVDVSFFEIKETKEEVRKILNMPLNKTIIGYVGRLETVGKEKGVDLLIESFKKLTTDKSQIVLYVVGGPDELASRYKNRYLTVENLVVVGQVEYKKIPQYLRAIDVVVIPMPDDRHAKTTSPIKLFEFLAAGKAIIASDLPTIKSYLNNNNAIFFRPGDIEDLANKIRIILSELGLIEKLSAKARIDSMQYSWLSRADKILKYCELD